MNRFLIHGVWRKACTTCRGAFQGVLQQGTRTCLPPLSYSHKNKANVYGKTLRFWLNLRLFLVAPFVVLAFLPSRIGMAYETARAKFNFSGYFKSFNFFTKTSGFTPEFVDNPLALEERGESVFSTQERLRLSPRMVFKVAENQRVVVKIDYDHQARFGSFVGTGDHRIARQHTEKRQFLDLSQTLVENGAYYEHRFYRASFTYETAGLALEIGRQQIPWGLGHFFTPTDLFNPFNPTQLELEERDGVDAINLRTGRWKGYKFQFVYTPRGRALHPQRYVARVSEDVEGFELGILGGRVGRDHVAGFDLAGNIRDSAVRGEFLYREVDGESDFFKFTVNADYNFPGNIHVLLEYHFNGEGRRDPTHYQTERLIRGEIQQVGKNYLGLFVGHDITPLLRFENRTIMNMDDVSFFIRPELQYEMKANLLLTVGAQIFAGHDGDELGDPFDLYFCEAKYSF